MIKIVLTGLWGIIWGLSARAQPLYEGGVPADAPIGAYFAAAYPKRDKSIIYVFYDDEPCDLCAQTVALTKEIYERYYARLYDFAVINRQTDTEYDFTAAYRLNAPLSIVFVRQADGEGFGYKKIDNPQNFYEAPEDYTRYLVGQINDYLGDF
jgi:hypothetical protein